MSPILPVGRRLSLRKKRAPRRLLAEFTNLPEWLSLPSPLQSASLSDSSNSTDLSSVLTAVNTSSTNDFPPQLAVLNSTQLQLAISSSSVLLSNNNLLMSLLNGNPSSDHTNCPPKISTPLSTGFQTMPNTSDHGFSENGREIRSPTPPCTSSDVHSPPKVGMKSQSPPNFSSSALSLKNSSDCSNASTVTSSGGNILGDHSYSCRSSPSATNHGHLNQDGNDKEVLGRRKSTSLRRTLFGSGIYNSKCNNNDDRNDFSYVRVGLDDAIPKTPTRYPGMQDLRECLGIPSSPSKRFQPILPAIPEFRSAPSPLSLYNGNDITDSSSSEDSEPNCNPVLQTEVISFYETSAQYFEGKSEILVLNGVNGIYGVPAQNDDPDEPNEFQGLNGVSEQNGAFNFVLPSQTPTGQFPTEAMLNGHHRNGFQRTCPILIQRFKNKCRRLSYHRLKRQEQRSKYTHIMPRTTNLSLSQYFDIISKVRDEQEQRKSRNNQLTSSVPAPATSGGCNGRGAHEGCGCEKYFDPNYDAFNGIPNAERDEADRVLESIIDGFRLADRVNDEEIGRGVDMDEGEEEPIFTDLAHVDPNTITYFNPIDDPNWRPPASIASQTQVHVTQDDEDNHSANPIFLSSDVQIEIARNNGDPVNLVGNYWF